MDNKNKNYNCNTIKERRIMIYLIILCMILLYISLFFIHNIVDVGTVRHSQSAEIDYPKNPDNNNMDDNNVDDSNKEDNNIGTSDMGNNSIEDNHLSNNENVGGQNTPSNQNPNIGDTEGNNGNDLDNDVIVDNNSRFRVLEGAQEWSNLKELRIFNNIYFQEQAIIAPGVNGNYSFTVENYLDTIVKYNIRFMEENSYNINMVYKLKLNGSYIAGSENQWVNYEDLCKNGLIINNHTSDLFTIEWKWEDNDNDTQIGESGGANYKLKVQLDAEDDEH